MYPRQFALHRLSAALAQDRVELSTQGSAVVLQLPPDTPVFNALVHHLIEANYLREAARSGDLDMVKVIVERAIPEVLNAPYAAHSSPMVLAAQNGHVEIVALLEQAQTDKVQGTPGHLALLAAISHGHVEAVDALVQTGVEFDAGFDLDAPAAGSHTLLMHAGAHGHKAVAGRLLQWGADPHVFDVHGDNALLLAIAHGHADTVQVLASAALAQPLDLNAVDESSEHTPLTLAAALGEKGVVQVLLQAGADPNAALPDGDTALIVAATYGHADVSYALLQEGAHANTHGHGGHTALTRSAQYGHTDTVNILLQAGADANASLADGSTALMLAALHGHTDTVQTLTQAAADTPPPLDLHATESSGHAPLLAASGGQAGADTGSAARDASDNLPAQADAPEPADADFADDRATPTQEIAPEQDAVIVTGGSLGPGEPLMG